MGSKKSIGLVYILLVAAVMIVGSAAQAEAEVMNYKFYTWIMKYESVPVGDIEGHSVGFGKRGGFYVFENGEIATIEHVSTTDWIKGTGPFMQYVTIKFQDGSTIIIKGQGIFKGASGGWTSEIIKGTGRFEGIQGTQSANAKYLPKEQGEAGPKGYGEGSITSLLSKINQKKTFWTDKYLIL